MHGWRALFLFIGLLLPTIAAVAQQCAVTGRVLGEVGEEMEGAYVTIYKGRDTLHTFSNEEGSFSFGELSCGNYMLQVRYTGYIPFLDTISADGTLHLIRLQRGIHKLKEVTVVQKAPIAVQRGDTVAYSAAGYRVNPDADAADLVKKMPTIDITNNHITAGGEPVTRVLVDGIPFYGNDAMASLTNLPAEMINRVQVYTELTDLEKYTGYREGAGTKTINIVTHINKRNGVFGNVYGGTGGDGGNDMRYGVGASLNSFGGQRRISANGHGNNVNRQSYKDISAATGGIGGISDAMGGGVSYSDKWGKANVSGNYMLTNSSTTQQSEISRIYVTPSAAGQIYKESNPASNTNKGHQASMRISMAPDSLSTLGLSPQVFIQQIGHSIARSGTTWLDNEVQNTTENSNEVHSSTYNLGGSATYVRQLGGGRSVSADVNASTSGSNGTTYLKTHDTFFGTAHTERTTDQMIATTNDLHSIASTVQYTAPRGKHGLLKALYSTTWRPTIATRYTMDYAPATGGYVTPDSAASNAFEGNATSHRTGLSYRHIGSKMQMSVGLYGQYSILQNEQSLPRAINARYTFANMLPTASVQYNIRKGRHLQLNYNTETRTPSVTDMQEVVNNTDPLHLRIGNPGLQQPYSHTIKLRYSATGHGGSSIFSLTAGGNLISNYITSVTTIARQDTVVRNVQLLRGGQLSQPVNAQGYGYYNTNVSYGFPLSAIKCKLTFFANADLTHLPLSINGVGGFMNIYNANVSAKLVSNISERVDFSLTARSMTTSTNSTISASNANVYVSHNICPSVNLTVLNGFVINTEADVRFNSGMQAGYNQNIALWNIAIGKKIMKNHKGDIRLSVYDVLNRNTNIRHSVSDTYVQDVRSNVLQRYALLTFAYRISSFKE